MFNAPQIITQIPDIAELYDINEDQCDDLDDAVQELDDDLFLSDMHESFIARWEKILGITPGADDTLPIRRFRIITQMMDKLPYSYRVLCEKLDALCPGGYELELTDNKTNANILIAVGSLSAQDSVSELLDRVLPLMMTYSISTLYTRYGRLTRYTHNELATRTHQQIRDGMIF